MLESIKTVSVMGCKDYAVKRDSNRVHCNRWYWLSSTKVVIEIHFFSAHLYISSSSPYRTVSTGLRCDRIMDQAMAEFRQSFIWEQVKDTWQPAGPVLSIAEYTLDPARNGREKEILT
jgi:hypothetical protein